MINRTCCECKETKPKTRDFFHVDSHHHSGFRRNCKLCHTAKMKKRRWEKRMTVLKLLGNECAKCGFNIKAALQIDHVNGGGLTERKVGNGNYYIYKKILEGDTANYQLLCANCNWIKRFENEEWA